MRRSNDFEPELLARITHPGRVGRPRRRRRIGAWWWQIPMVALLAACLGGAWWLFPRGHDGALAELARETYASLQANDATRLPRATHTAEEQARLREQFEHLSRILEEQDINLASTQAIAYGGARARVSQANATGPGVWASVGNLYLNSEGRLVAIEYGARRDDGTYLLTDLWTAEIIGPASLSAAESHARSAYREFLEQDNEPGAGARLRSTRFVFFSLQ